MRKISAALSTAFFSRLGQFAELLFIVVQLIDRFNLNRAYPPAQRDRPSPAQDPLTPDSGEENEKPAPEQPERFRNFEGS